MLAFKQQCSKMSTASSPSPIISPSSLFSWLPIFPPHTAHIHPPPSVSHFPHLTGLSSSACLLSLFLPESLWSSAPHPCESGWTYLPRDTGTAVICQSDTHTHIHRFQLYQFCRQSAKAQQKEGLKLSYVQRVAFIFKSCLLQLMPCTIYTISIQSY